MVKGRRHRVQSPTTSCLPDEEYYCWYWITSQSNSGMLFKWWYENNSHSAKTDGLVKFHFMRDVWFVWLISIDGFSLSFNILFKIYFYIYSNKQNQNSKYFYFISQFSSHLNTPFSFFHIIPPSHPNNFIFNFQSKHKVACPPCNSIQNLSTNQISSSFLYTTVIRHGSLTSTFVKVIPLFTCFNPSKYINSFHLSYLVFIPSTHKIL